MTTFTISRLAERSGFTTSTLRYYEEVGLLATPDRTPSGYRSYDDRTLERLRFVGRAKSLGLPLREIRDLVSAWDSEPCAGVRGRLHSLVVTKQAAVRERVGELTAFASQLAAAETELAGATQSGPPQPCGDGCGCLPNSTAAQSGPEVLVECTLDGPGQATRQTEWADLLSQASTREAVPDGLVLRFPAHRELAGRLAELVLAEQQCCAFYSFTLGFSTEDLVLTVTAPGAGTEVVHLLFGRP